MKLARIITAAAGVLALGAATTVGIAWGAAYFGWGQTPLAGPILGIDDDLMLRRGEYFLVQRADSWVRTRVDVQRVGIELNVAFGVDEYNKAVSHWRRWREHIPGWARTGAMPPSPATPSWERQENGWSFWAGERRQFEAFGWPMRAVWYDRTDSNGKPLAMTHGAIKIAGPAAAFAAPGELYLPYLPAWPGLLADIGVFAAAWALPMAAIPVIRRRIRTRRGRCTACGYDLCGTPAGTPCSECGLPRARGAPTEVALLSSAGHEEWSKSTGLESGATTDAAGSGPTINEPAIRRSPA